MATRAGIKAAVRAALAACTAAASIPVSALGLGDIRIQSFLNEPLRAEVELLDTRQLLVDDIRIRLAENEDFDRLGVERSYFLTGIQFEVRIDAATGQGVILLSTEEAVLEPYLDFIIEARWPSGRLLREYTVLVDPPVFRQDMVTVSVAERVEAMTSKPPAGEPAPSTQSTRESSSGDSVRLRESTLPPGEMPERAFSAETSSTPVVGKRYMVRRDETLWEIAAQARPQGITVQQAMLDIQRLNPEAFIDGNINLIKAGYIIYLPAAGEVNSDDLATALDEVRSQNEQWRARRIPGVTAAATLRVSAAPPPEGARDASGADESSMPAPPSRDAAEGTAVPAAADRDGDGPEATESSAQAQGSGAQESAAQDPAPPAGASTASAQLLAQLDAMSERLDTVEQIIAVKDEQIATLQQALREAREAAAAAARRSAPVAQQVAMRPASGGIPWLPIAVGGGLLILFVSVALLLRRRARSPAGAAAAAAGRARGDDVFTGVSLNKDALDGGEEPEQPEADEHAATALTEPRDAEDAEQADVDEILDPGGSRGYGERRNDDYIDDAAAGDALAEADIYIAYGRYLQAVELLTEAVNNEPANSAYRTKLIELYVDMGERQNAAEQLGELRAHGDADAIARAEELLGGMADADADAEGDSAEPLDFNDLPGADEQLADADSAAPEAAATTPEAAEPAASFEADLPGDDASVSEPAPAGEPEATPVSLEPQDPLEFSLEDLETAKPAESPGSAVSQSPASEAAKETQTLEFDELDIVVDSAEPAASEEPFDLVDELTPAAHSEVSAAEEEEEEEEVLIADDADQMATKLDLARAYLDMGDGESARGMLEEVAGNGSAQQRQEAQELLSRID